MSFRLNSSQQLSLFDKLAFLSPRKLKMLQNSWAQTFSNHVFTKIDEQIFAPLYSEKTNSRPNAPINVIIGALILKDFTGQTEMNCWKRLSLITAINTPFTPPASRNSLSATGHSAGSGRDVPPMS